MSENQETQIDNPEQEGSDNSLHKAPTKENLGSPAKGGFKESLSTIANLRTEKPLYFYGGIVALLVLFWIVAVRPGGTEIETPKISMGQTYTLNNPNGGKVLLTSVPTFSSADYVAEDSINVCVSDPGSRAKVIEQRQVNFIPYIRVEAVSGNCQGKKGWTSSVNINP